MMLDPDTLTRHAVCLGMTGSGKTGLCVGLLEDLAHRGVPVLAVDPKGDLSNMALVFPELTTEAFRPWTPDPQEACATWRAAITPEATRAYLSRVEVRVLSPGSESGTPVDVLTTLTRAPLHLRDDVEGLREWVIGAVSALLGLIGRPADPLTDPAAILLARLLGDAFARGDDLPLDTLIPQVVDPPFTELGYFAVDTVMPRPDRLALAKALNAVVASPAFEPWRRGVPLDVGAWLSAPTGGKTPVTVLYLAHLDEAQRMFFVTLLLYQVVGWSRRQPGARALRALLYMDEVMGYLPPHPRNPTTKWPVLALMKQARAVGVGVMLCTQNPVDLDYKAMSNAATWLVGRLQTRQDRQRVLDGMATAGVDVGDLDDAIAALPPRSFVLRDGAGTRTVRSRHTLAFLRGPLTRGELGALARAVPPATPSDGTLGAPPPPPDELPVRWLDPPGCATLGLTAPSGAVVWRPALVARWAVRFTQAGQVEDRVAHQVLFPLTEDTPPRPIALSDEHIHRKLPAGGRYTTLPAWFFPRGAMSRLREAWRDQATREQVWEGPHGRVAADRSDVRPLAWALVWVPGKP